MAHAPRNTQVGGIGRLGRAAVFKKRALYKRKKAATVKAAEPKPATVTKDIGGDKNGMIASPLLAAHALPAREGVNRYAPSSGAEQGR